jgi:hypothetical protein
MADHGRNADGATGGIATGNTGSADATGAERAAAPNVVPFPGDWIGPLDELVPIDLDLPEDDSSDASSFWDGDPTALHDAIGSAALRVGSTRPRVGSTGARVGSAAPGSAGRQPPPSIASAPSWPRYKRRGRSWPLFAGVLLALVLAAVVVLVLSHGNRVHESGQPKTVGSAPATVTSESLNHRAKPSKSKSKAGRVTHRAKSSTARATSSADRTRPSTGRTKPATRRTKPTKVRTATKPAAITKQVTVTVQAPVTYTPPVQQTAAVTTAPAAVQHTAAAPPKPHVTSHATHTTSCVMSPDSGCLP